MVTLVSRTGRQFQRYNNNGCRQVVGCIPYRYKNCNNIENDDTSEEEEEVEVLLISSQKGQARGMMFPKGGWELDESMEEAALRESMEEAGVSGQLECKLGDWKFKSKRYGTYYDGYMFSLLVKEQLESWPEKNSRTRRWVTVAEAREVCQQGWMKEALDELVRRLTPATQE